MADVEDVQDNAVFIKKIVTWWKIINIKGLGAEKRHNEDPQDTRLDYLLEFGDMCREMMTNKKGNQIKQLSKDTAMNIHHTYHGMIFVDIYLGQFTTDFLEKEFSKLPEESGGHIFYISATSS